jgi:hypothetical protein
MSDLNNAGRSIAARIVNAAVNPEAITVVGTGQVYSRNSVMFAMCLQADNCEQDDLIGPNPSNRAMTRYSEAKAG